MVHYNYGSVVHTKQFIVLIFPLHKLRWVSWNRKLDSVHLCITTAIHPGRYFCTYCFFKV